VVFVEAKGKHYAIKDPSPGARPALADATAYASPSDAPGSRDKLRLPGAIENRDEVDGSHPA
jgi:hypothetical protein